MDLKDLDPTDNQAVFDYVIKHLIEQGGKAEEVDPVRGVKTCRYRTDSGMSCAVGCLIPDEDYDPRFEGGGIIYGDPMLPELQASRLITCYLEKRGFNKMLLADLQDMHDLHLGKDSFESAMRNLADRYHLTLNLPS